MGRLQAMDSLIEAKGAFYYPTSSTFRQIYSSEGMFGLEASFKTWRQLYSWASGSVFMKNGHSIGLGDRTRIVFYPIGAGIKYLFPVDWMDFYLGGGPLGVYMHIHDHASTVTPKTCRWGGGGIVKGGAILNISHYLFFDFFTDYSFLYVPIPKRQNMITHNANLSGWSIGAGVGLRFGKRG